jgi:hypothetical protein
VQSDNATEPCLDLPQERDLAGGCAGCDPHAVPDDERRVRLGEAEARSAKGVERVGGHSEHSVYTVWRCIGRGPGGSSEPPEPRVCVSPACAGGWRCRSVLGDASPATQREHHSS